MPEAEAASPAPEAAPTKRVCKFCGEQKLATHDQWCQKNPNRRTKVFDHKAAPGGPKKRDYKAEHERRKAKKAAASPAAKPTEPAPAPAKPEAKSQEAFLQERQAELKGTAPKPGEKPADETPAPTGDAKPPAKSSTKTWLVLGIAGLGALLFMWALANDQPQGEQPRNRGQRQAQDAELKPNGVIPGVGAVHVPGLGA